MSLLTEFQPELTADGSFTFYSKRFGEAFHNRQGARAEAAQTFVQPTQLALKAQQQDASHLLDVCYGLGYNTAEALATIWASNPACVINAMGLELELAVPQAAIAHDLLADWPTPIPDWLTQVATTGQVQTPTLNLHVHWGDARQTLPRLVQAGFQADAIFLDPFSPRRCPQLWTVEFLQIVAHCLKPDGYLTTYSSSAAVRVGLMTVGLQVGSLPGLGRPSPGTLAAWRSLEQFPLSQQEREHLQTQAAIPYRDPSLKDAAATIQQRRVAEQAQSNLSPTTQWRKRWQVRGSAQVSQS
jgi:tRNA U34 5-methylaminomethyl-2-thiouridine-forming methyltransferase MnmC